MYFHVGYWDEMNCTLMCSDGNSASVASNNPQFIFEYIAIVVWSHTLTGSYSMLNAEYFCDFL